jgi:hypothetical protein
MLAKSDHVEALICLDPMYLAPEDRGPAHPAVLYTRQPWSGSTVRAFPMANNRHWLIALAAEIVTGRRRGGVQSQLMRRAKDLWLSQVPRDLAEAELRDLHHRLTDLVEAERTVPGVKHGHR